MLTTDRYLESFRSDATELLDLAGDAPDAAVEHCGDWLATDLVSHLVQVWTFLSHHVAIQATERDKSLEMPELEGAELFEHARGLVDRVDDLFGALDPEEVVWSWANDHTGGFYHRRIAQETAVHAWDIRTAVGVADAIPTDMARDGVDEMIDMFFPVMMERGLPEPTGSLHLHCTDAEGEWTVSVDNGTIVAAREHSKGDAAIRGAASDLNLAMWERVPLDSDALQVFGDTDVAAGWTALSR